MDEKFLKAAGVNVEKDEIWVAIATAIGGVVIFVIILVAVIF